MLERIRSIGTAFDPAELPAVLNPEEAIPEREATSLRFQTLFDSTFESQHQLRQALFLPLRASRLIQPFPVLIFPTSLPCIQLIDRRKGGPEPLQTGPS